MLVSRNLSTENAKFYDAICFDKNWHKNNIDSTESQQIQYGNVQMNIIPLQRRVGCEEMASKKKRESLEAAG